jgi:hypothetical protein
LATATPGFNTLAQFCAGVGKGLFFLGSTGSYPTCRYPHRGVHGPPHQKSPPLLPPSPRGLLWAGRKKSSICGQAVRFGLIMTTSTCSTASSHTTRPTSLFCSSVLLVRSYYPGVCLCHSGWGCLLFYTYILYLYLCDALIVIAYSFIVIAIIHLLSYFTYLYYYSKLLLLAIISILFLFQYTSTSSSTV